MPLFLLILAVFCFALGSLVELFDWDLGELTQMFLLFLGLTAWASSALPFWSRRQP